MVGLMPFPTLMTNIALLLTMYGVLEEHEYYLCDTPIGIGNGRAEMNGYLVLLS